VDDSPRNFFILEPVVEGEIGFVPSADNDYISNFEDSLHALHYCEYKPMLRLGEVGDGKQIPDHGLDFFRDFILNHTFDKLLGHR
jgi:hypothetical protein